MAGRGRPAREPTAAERKKVKEFLAEKASQKLIAAALDISVPTLRKFFAAELGLEKKSALDQPPFRLTEQMREDVALLAACNEPHGRIAKAIGVSDADLGKYFGEDLEIGSARYRLKALKRLDNLAQLGSLGAANKLAALTTPAAEAGPAAAAGGGYSGKKVKQKAEAVAASSGGKFAPRSAPRLAAVDGKPVT